MAGRIRLLFVLGSMHNGGTEVFVMNYFRLLDKDKFEIDFLVVGDEEEYFKSEIEGSGCQIFHLSMSDDAKYKYNFNKINHFFKGRKYDIIHIHSCSLRFMGIIAYVAKHKHAGLVVGHAHSAGEPTGSFIDNIVRVILKRFVSANLDYGMACSTDSAEAKYTERFMDSRQYQMIPNAIDTEKYIYNEDTRNRIRLQLGLTGKYVIGIVGRLEKQKNQSFLMEAVQIVNRSKEIYMLIIGDGDIREELEKKAVQLEIQDKVIFTGAVGNANEYYSAMDLFCLPSYAEGFPFVLVEAQANGLRCLISDEISRETDVSGTAKYLSIKDPGIWSDAIVKYNGKRISNENVQYVKETYDIGHAVIRLENFYDDILHRREGKARMIQ